MIPTAENNSISSFPSYDRLHKHFLIRRNSKCQTNSTIQISSYSLKLDFSIVELQKRGNSLFSFRKRANECLISEKRVFAHFLPAKFSLLHVLSLTNGIMKIKKTQKNLCECSTKFPRILRSLTNPLNQWRLQDFFLGASLMS